MATMTICPKCNQDTLYGLNCYNCGYKRDIRVKRDDSNTKVSNPSLKYMKYRVTRKQSEMVLRKWQSSKKWWSMSYMAYRRTWHLSWETLVSDVSGIVVGIEPDGYAHS